MCYLLFPAATQSTPMIQNCSVQYRSVNYGRGSYANTNNVVSCLSFDGNVLCCQIIPTLKMSAFKKESVMQNMRQAMVPTKK